MGEGRAAASAGGARGVVQGGAMSVVVEWRGEPVGLGADGGVGGRRGGGGRLARVGGGGGDGGAGAVRYNVGSRSVQVDRDCVEGRAAVATARVGRAG